MYNKDNKKRNYSCSGQFSDTKLKNIYFRIEKRK